MTMESNSSSKLGEIWEFARKIPMSERYLIISSGYSELAPDEKEYIDCQIDDFLNRIRDRGAGSRFSKPMARELFYAIIQYLIVANIAGFDWDWRG